MSVTRKDFDRALSLVSINRSDCERIVAAAEKELGLTITMYEAQVVWSWWSDRQDASWLMTEHKEPGEIADVIRRFVAESD